jgi:hypothetical protein
MKLTTATATLIFMAFTSVLGAVSWLKYEGYQTAITKAKIEADAKVAKALNGHRFRFGILKKGE